MESISRKNGCPLNHICQKICKAAVSSTGTSTNNHCPAPVLAESRAVVTKLTGVHVEDMLRDYTGRVKKKLRTLSNKQNSMPDGGSDEFSDYAGHVKNNFTRFPSTTATIYMEY
ncbi:hypothetical protein LINPERPRIM_LOCUS7069 [Linum perenne]